MRDSTLQDDIVTVAALGALAGTRSLLPQAVISRALTNVTATRLPQPLSQLASVAASRGLAALALMELAGDKMPGMPHRVAPVPLIGRIVSGGAAGFITGMQKLRNAPLFGLVGAASAALTTVVFYRVRMYAIQRLGVSSTLSGLVEDGLALLAARSLTKRLTA